MNEVSILIGGKAGDGIKKAAYVLGKLLLRKGLYVSIYNDYQSLIRGGHNFSIVRASKDKILSHKNEVDILLGLDQNTINLHKDQVKKFMIVEENINYDGNLPVFRINSEKFVQEKRFPRIMRISAYLGAAAKSLGIEFPLIETVFKKEYKDEKNIEVAKLGYYKDLPSLKISGHHENTILITGNEAAALGALQANLKVYIAYPMTPSTSILHYMAKHQDEFNIKVIQPENEISVINMALGASYAGVRVAVGTSGGGFALMNEALSLAGMSETPIVIFISSRAGPSTGVPTYTAQSELRYAIHAGHGEFPRFVIAPGDPAEVYYKTIEAFELSDKFQVPSIILLDKHLSEDHFTVEKFKEIKISKREFEKSEGIFPRYKITESGISPLSIPGLSIVKATSYEHDEYGITTEDPKKVKAMADKRMRKMDSMIRELRKRVAYKVYGDKNQDITLIGWGSTKGAILDALSELRKDYKVKYIHMIYLWPFPEWVKREIKGEIYFIENNQTGQLRSLFKEFLGVDGFLIAKYDSRPFTGDYIYERVI